MKITQQAIPQPLMTEISLKFAYLKGDIPLTQGQWRRDSVIPIKCKARE